MSDNIKVVVKVRPLISREIDDKLSYQWRVKNDTLYQLDQSGREVGSCFTFDKVYDKETKTNDVYKDVAKPIVEATTAGFNGTIFAYGQTSSGKTYTMTGTEHSPGIIPLAVSNLFEIIKNIPNRDFLVRVSYLEIYNETVKDLLNIEKKNIKVHDTLQGVKVDVTEMVTTSPEEVFKYLKEGEANRQTGATNMNEESSRSHSIFQIIIESRDHIEGDEEATGCVNVSQLNLVDLAGSERAGQTGATGLRFKEGTHINKSLSSLALVIKQLSEDPNKYVNYRDSKLTRILQNSLGGNAKTSIICAITPAAVEETISTLQFANRAKAIKNKPEVNAVATDATMIQSLTKQLCRLQAQLETKKDLEVMLESKKNVEQDNQQLQTKIAALQRLILNGFGQRSSAEIIGPRRKNIQPRRVTISTLHSIDEEHVTSVPKFCTPSLKYNPMSFSSDFIPIQNANKLETLPEEVRIITPPPRDMKVDPNDEIIDLVSSKTPPCVLRKNAKAAEENLKEIEELTKREKMYEPRVNELIEKLEHNTTVIAKLEDDINTLTKQSKEKDFQIEYLKAKIGKSENEMKTVTSAKADMEAKLVDLEVIYETLKQNTKRREEELLSLLDDKPKKNEDIGKMASRIFDKDLTHFMDMSKDISLVNSDNESSISNTNDDGSSSHTQDLNAEMMTQLTSKVETIQKLESNICVQNKKIETLELSCREFERMITTFKASLSQTEHENALLKATIDTLNSTISNQKMNLDSAHSDIDSCNSIIQDLQNKLKEKETNVSINDSILEKMIDNEEKFIANNDNMKNIIESFKNTLDARKKEIDSLKSKQSNFIEADNIIAELTEKLKAKNVQVDLLNEEAQKCNIRINEKEALINKLESEKNDWGNIQHQLSEKLTRVVEKHDKLERQYSETMSLVENLKLSNEQLSFSVSEKEARHKELETINEELNIEIETLSKKIVSLEDDNKSKDNILNALRKEESELEDHLTKAKSSVNKLQNILLKLTGNVQEVPEIIDNFVVIFSTMNNSLNILESTVAEVVSQREANYEIINSLKNELVVLNEKYNEEIKVLQSQIESFVINEDEITRQKDSLQQELNQITRELETTGLKLDATNVQCKDLETKLGQITEKYTALQSDILSKNSLIVSLHTSSCSLRPEILNLRKETQQLCHNFTNDIEHLKGSVRNMQISFEELLGNKETEIVHLETELKEMTKNLSEKTTEISKFSQEISVVTEKCSQILKTILVKVIDLGNNLIIENNFLCDIDDVDIDNVYDQITHNLDKIVNSIKSTTTYKNKDCDNIDKNVSQAKHEITLLSEQNTKCMECLCLETKHQELSNQLEVIRTEKDTFKNDLIDTNALLISLQKELQTKVTEMDAMEAKISKWQELDFSLNQLVEQLQIENLQLKSRCSELEAKSSGRDICDVEYNPNYTGKKSFCNLIETPQHYTPPSLLSICCEKIVDYIHPKDNSSSTLSSETSVDHINKETPCNNCEILLSELTTSHNSNLKYRDSVMELENINRQLLQEQEEIHKEVKLLLEPAYELQKKVINHRTNLSTLTATTYAENKLLKSQVKALQHHHSRFHMVCQKDIPAVKQQLGELMSILKNESSCFNTANTCFKRFSLPETLENKSVLSNFKNDETTLDGDLLMLDTTLTTSADNTLLGHDQTCLDTTQTFLYNEVIQISDAIKLTNLETNLDMEVLSDDYKKMRQNLEVLKHENYNLREQVDKYSRSVASKIDTQTSPIKMDTRKCDTCEKYRNEITESYNMQQKLNKTIELLSQELFDLKMEKERIDEKYKNLTLEIPSTDALIRKLSTIEKEKDSEIAKLAQTITNHRLEIKRLQDENDTLSTQVMENITEVDDLNDKLQTLKELNIKLANKCTELQDVKEENNISLNNRSCPQCIAKDDMTRSLCITTAQPHSKFNRSMSESDTSSRFNKICTLQNELHAGKEDCKELTEDVTTIKNHLERNNLSMSQNMDLDDSIVHANIFTFTKDFEVEPPLNKVMSNIPEEQITDIYRLDKNDCIKYYKEITGTEMENIDYNIKLIDVMKMFYNDIVAKHNTNAEILINKLKEYEHSRNEIEVHVKNLNSEYKKIIDELEEKDKQFEETSNVLLLVKNNINTMAEEISKFTETEINAKIVMIFKEKFLNVLDAKFSFTSTSVFEHLIDTIVNKHEMELTDIVNRNNKMQEHLESVIAKLDIASENLLQMKSQLTDKEAEYNLLKAQKERIHEISHAVTLDIIKKEQELSETVATGCQKLVELNVISSSDINLALPINKNVQLIINHFIAEIDRLKKESDKKHLVQEIIEMKTTLESKEKLLETLKVQNDKLQEINSSASSNLTQKDNLLREQKLLHDELNTVYKAKVKENEANLNVIAKLAEEINVLKEDIVNKQASINSLESEFKTYKHSSSENENKITELISRIACLNEEVNSLKTVNDVLIKEKETCIMELARSKETINQNKSELEKMTSDILILRESVKDNVSVIETLKVEAKSLLQQNLQLKMQFEEKCKDCSRLEMNIKTHEKTAEIQSKMIIRLQKQKEEGDQVIVEKSKQLDQLTQEFLRLQKQLDHMQDNLKSSKEEIDALRSRKESLELRITELETDLDGHRRRKSVEPNVDASRRRRQSIYDSQRIFSDAKQEAGDIFKTEPAFQLHTKIDDQVTDADDDSSNRSTPLRLSKGRDSLHSRGDQDEEVPSRPNSVQATRRRRQSSHDLHRSVSIPTPDPHDLSRRLLDDLNSTKPGDSHNARDLEQMKLEFLACKQELEELRERYKELDEECETCAEYLRERDEQCLRLKKEKATLENIVADLREKLQAANPSKKQQEFKRVFSDASVNTDEDWANLHSVVVDRMSYDAEVEKRKRLTKTIEELRFKNQDLRTTLAKMQKSFDKNSGKDKEFETMKKELQASKVELEELRERYKELDEECETCAEYLRQRDEQCRKLKEAKMALEAKLQEFQSDHSAVLQTSRRRRQTLHDQNRGSVVHADVHDATTETSDDFLSYQVERDHGKQAEDKSREMKHLKMAVEKLTQQKTALEHQLMTMSHPMYIATGSAIVQNQQLTDVMKENQKLKKINAKLVTICKKRGKDTNRENEDPSEQLG